MKKEDIQKDQAIDESNSKKTANKNGEKKNNNHCLCTWLVNPLLGHLWFIQLIQFPEFPQHIEL